MIEDLRAAQTSLLLGVSPLELLTGVIAMRLILGASDEARRASWLTWTAAAALLPPSGAGAWATLCLFALLKARRSQGEVRAGYLIFSALGAAELWANIGFKLAAGPLLAADAQATAWLLQSLGFEATRVGNVVEVANGNNIVVLLACATLHRLPIAALAAVALSTPAPARELAKAVAWATAGYTIINMGRLVAMGWSPESYAFMHNGAGASLFDAALVALVFLAARRSGP